MEMTDSLKYLKDPIYGQIKLDDFVLQFIDTHQFQRLRYLRQLGAIYFIYPGGNHTRFEHSIGVSYLAKTLITILREKHPELHISERDVKCVTLAGLCHDLGHGPFSHLFDGKFITSALPGTQWRHENGSEMMLDYLITQNGINMPNEDIDFIKDLILGEPRYTKCREKKFFFDIIANKRNGLDVDRFDYIARDSYYTGLKSTYDYMRLLLNCRVINDQICFDHKEIFDIYELMHSRYSLNKRIYFHKTAKAIDLMICDAMLLSDKHLKISESISDPAKYMHLTDDILRDIQKSDCEELSKARQLIERIHCRKLYRMADYIIFRSSEVEKFGKDWISAKIVVDQVKRIQMQMQIQAGEQNSNLCEVGEENVRVCWSVINFGMGKLNPLTKVQFYSKADPKSSYSVDAHKEIICLPPEYQEVVLRIYVTEDWYISVVKKAMKQIYVSVGLDL